MPQIASGLTLDQLERDLQELSHGQEALTRIQGFSAGLKKTASRQMLFNAAGALICDPIDYQAALEAGKIPASEDEFRLLQGDLINTETAYFFGERITGQARFIVASSSCDLIANRRQYASLLRVKPLRAEDPNIKEQLNILLRFASSKAMYLPPLIDDLNGLVGQAVDFDGVVQVQLTDLLLAKREASLSLIGWRIFGSMLRAIMVMSGDHEASLRM